MTLYDIRGRLVNRMVARFRLKWEKPSRSKLQFRVKQLLKPIWFTDIVFEEFPVFGSLLKIDFYNGTKRVAVEVNGPQHEEFNPFFHGDSPQQFIKGIKRDLHKHTWCERNQIRLVEILESDLSDIRAFYARIQDESNS
jgi:hypothetical protein